MLANLKIENIAIIERASIDFDNNFNCMTGETGAGKSIVIDSINAVLGEKTSRELIRTGENKATVSAYFTDISDKTKNILNSFGLPCEEDSSLLIVRTMTRDGRNICRVNGENVTVSMLKAIGFNLINIHGQSDNQALMSPEMHYTFIDAVADNSELLEKYSASYKEMLEIKAKINKLNVDDALKARKIDLLEYQIDELQKADIKPGERDELMTKRNIINNSQKLMTSLSEAYGAINGSDEYPGAASMLFDIANALSVAAQYLPEAAPIYENINDIAYTIDAYSSDISDMLENSVVDERELSYIEERLDTIYRMSKKYGETEEEILDFLNNAIEELHNITYSDELLEKLNADYDKCRKKTYETALKLSETRRSAAAVFEKRIMEELAFLNMPDTVFSVSINECEFCETGIDNIEFLISANKGEASKPLAKIASGGELSRIMLAIKSVLADKDNTDTLIFDEIDTGVSGRAAGKIAVKLYDVSKHRQVICITHLSAIASFADHHMLISKAVHGEKTYTSVTTLDENGRAAELARMIGGDENDKTFTQSAKRLIAEADNYKKECGT